MEIFKVGDEISISGYKGIKLSDDMQKNVSEFAKVNGVELTEAERILGSVPGIKEFAETIYTDDADEDIEILEDDFTLEDNEFDVAKMTNNVQPPLKLSAVREGQAVSASNNVNKITPKINLAADVILAEKSSDNEEDLKDLLGIFGFSASTVIPESDLIMQGNKILGFKLNGKSYEVIVDDKGVITETKITDANGNTEKGFYPPDPRAEMQLRFEKYQQQLCELIEPFIRQTSLNYSSQKREELFRVIKNCINNHKQEVNIDNMLLYVKASIADPGGFDVTELNKAYKHLTLDFLSIKDACSHVCDVSAEIIAYDKEEAKYTKDTINIDGVNLKYRFLTGQGSCKIEEDTEGNIVITGSNCSVDLMGYGQFSKNVIINGSGITFNGNATTLDTITNNAKNSTINGSFGNDNVVNNTGAENCKINLGDSDDVVLNYAANVNIKGNDGNDTIVNYGPNAKIDGGKGDDVINYVDGSAEITPSEGKDTKNVIVAGGKPIPDPEDEYKWFYDFEVNGIKFRAFSKTNNFDTVKTSFYKNLLTITVTDMKILILDAQAQHAVALEGSSIKFSTNKTLKAVFNNASNSVINGSDGKDYLYNYANNSTLNGGAGDDVLINEGTYSTINGQAGADKIYERDKGIGSTTIKDAQDKIYDGDPSVIKVEEYKPIPTPTPIPPESPVPTADENMEVSMSYIQAALSGLSEPTIEGASQEAVSAAKNLVSKLVTTDGQGKKVYSSLAQSIINAAKKLHSSINDDFKLLELGLKNIDTSNDGKVSNAELEAFEEGAATEPDDKQAELEKAGNEIKSLVGLTSTQLNSFIQSCGSTDAALAKLKQIKAMISIGTQMDTRTKEEGPFIETVKNIMTSSVSNFNNEILADAQILVDAENAPEGKNAYIKSQMIVDGSSLSLTQLAAQTKAGDVAEKNGKLYVNDSGTMVELNMSADTYVKLFPPVERFFVQQNGYEDCFFVATSMIESMENPAAKAKLLQMFSENKSTGDITITFPGVSNYPVTFAGGNLKKVDGYYNGKNVGTHKASDVCKGFALLEQAYALAKFAEVSNENLSYTTIKDDYSKDLADAIKASGKVSNASNLDMDMALQYYVNGGFGTEALNDLYGKKSTDDTIMIQGKTNYADMSTLYSRLITNNMLTTTVIYSEPAVSAADKQKYGLVNSHQYAIESINPSAKTITIKNPFASYETIELPFDVFYKYFNRINTKLLD